MNAISGTNNLYNPRYNPYVEKTKVNDLSSLTFAQTSVLNEVKSIVAGLGDSAVKVQVLKPQLQENGMTISVMGFMSIGDNGTGDFAIGIDMLEKMTMDEKYKQETLAKIKEHVESAKRNQSKQSILSQSMPVQVPVTYMDFWNDDKDNNKSFLKNYYSQTAQSFIEKYEKDFNFM